MTLPDERTNAVIRTREFLLRLSSPYGGGIKGVPSDVRVQARALLRHFPAAFDLCRDGAWDRQTVEQYYETRKKALQ